MTLKFIDGAELPEIKHILHLFFLKKKKKDKIKTTIKGLYRNVFQLTVKADFNRKIIPTSQKLSRYSPPYNIVLCTRIQSQKKRFVDGAECPVAAYEIHVSFFCALLSVVLKNKTEEEERILDPSKWSQILDPKNSPCTSNLLPPSLMV